MAFPGRWPTERNAWGERPEDLTRHLSTFCGAWPLLLLLLAGAPTILHAQSSPSISVELSPGHHVPPKTAITATITLSNLDIDSYSSVIFRADLTVYGKGETRCNGDDTGKDIEITVEDSQEVFTAKVYNACSYDTYGNYTLNARIFQVDTSAPSDKVELAAASTRFLMSRFLMPGEVPAPPPALGVKAWLDPDPTSFVMYVGEWHEFRVRSDILLYLSDHLGVEMGGSEPEFFVAPGEVTPSKSVEEACQGPYFLDPNWRRAIHQALWIGACKAGDGVIQVRHETDAVEPLYRYEIRTVARGEDNTPVVDAVAITSNSGADATYAAGETIQVTVTFSKTVAVTGSPRLTLNVGGRNRTATYRSVTGAAVVFAYTVAIGDNDTDGVSIGADSLALNGGSIRDGSGDADLDHPALEDDTQHKVDGIKPVLASTDGAVANGTMLTLAYNEPLDSSSVPGNDAFSVAGGSETRTVTGVRMSGSAVELTLTPAVEHGETGLRVSYTVPTGSGATPIQDTAGNDAARLSNRSVTNVTGDTTGPAVETVRITSNAGSDRTYAVEDPIEVTVTFNETVVVTGTPELTLNVGSRSRTADSLSVVGAAVKFEYRVARGDSDRDGVSIEADSLSRGGGTIRDGAGNDATLDHAAVAADSRHKVDGIPPALATTDGAVVNGTTLTLAYSEPLNSSSRPAASAFTVTGGSEARTVTRVQVSGSAVLLMLNPAVTDGESGLRLSYQPGGKPIEDVVGNAADELNNRPVTNRTGDTTGPTVETVRITSNAGSDRTYVASETIEVTVTFSETVVVRGTPRLTLNLGGRSRTANYQDVTGAAVRFEYKVVSGDSAAYGVSIEANRLSSGTIRDGAWNNAVLSHAPVAADSRHQVDGVKPTLATSDGAVASGTTLTLAYGEPLDSSSVPATDDFTVTAGSETRTVTGVRVSGSAVFLTLSPAVADGESRLRVNYEPGSNPIQDTAGNDADRLSNKSVTNRTGDTTGPAVSRVRITSSAGSDRTYGVDETIEVTVTFDETLVITGTPELTLNVGGGNRSAEYRSVSIRAVKFAYRVVTGDNDEDGVSLESNRLSRAGGTIRDGAGNDAVLDHDAVADSSSHKVDAVAPVLALTDPAVVNGATLTLTYNEPLNTSSRPATSDFTLEGGNETRTVTRVRVSGSTVRLTVNPAVEHGETGSG